MNNTVQTGRGYTTPEMIIVLATLVIMASIALPSFASVLRKAQSQTVIHNLASTYQYARSAAISYRQPVVFCPRASDSTCGSDWLQGGIVFMDPDNNRIRSERERLLAIFEPPPAGSSLQIRAALNKRYLRFMSNGMLENTAGSFVYCPPGARDRDARTLIFTRNGRLRTGTDMNSDGILENAEGQPLSCPS